MDAVKSLRLGAGAARSDDDADVVVLALRGRLREVGHRVLELTQGLRRPEPPFLTTALMWVSSGVQPPTLANASGKCNASAGGRSSVPVRRTGYHADCYARGRTEVLGCGQCFAAGCRNSDSGNGHAPGRGLHDPQGKRASFP